jgi:hypothetical protein
LFRLVDQPVKVLQERPKFFTGLLCGLPSAFIRDPGPVQFRVQGQRIDRRQESLTLLKTLNR